MKRSRFNKLYYVGFPLVRGVFQTAVGNLADILARDSSHSSEVILPARPAELIKLFLDFENYGKYHPAIKRIDVRERTPKSARLKWTIDLEEAPIEWEDLVTLKEGSPKLVFKSVAGDFDKYVRKLEFKSEGDQTRLCSRIDIVFNLGHLNHIVGNVVKGKIARFNDEFLVGVKKISEQQR